MLYTEILYLIKQTQTQDNIGNIITEESKSKVYAYKKSVATKEYYTAVSVGITPTAEFQLRLSNYNNETEVEHNNIRYSVIRTIPKGRTDIVLVVGIKQGVKNG